MLFIVRCEWFGAAESDLEHKTVCHSSCGPKDGAWRHLGGTLLLAGSMVLKTALAADAGMWKEEWSLSRQTRQ